MEKKTIRYGLLWNSITNISRYGLSFFAVAVLARLLTPEDYGLIGIIGIFISVAEILVDAGLSGAVIKKNEVKDIDFDTLTVYNLIVSFLLYLVYYVSASFIADFYDKPILTNLIRLYSIVILIHALVIAPRTKLIKELRFKELSIINLVGGILGLSVAVIMAYLKYGVYSLIWQYIITAIVTSMLIYYRTRYKICLRFSYNSFKEQFSFGINTTLATSLKTFNENIYSNIIAKCTSITQTGYYTQAYKLMKVPNSFFFNLIDSTFFPILSQENNRVIFNEKIRKLNIKISVIIVLLFGLALSISKELIYILLGNKWLEVEWSLNILLLVGLFLIISSVGRNILKCLGMTKVIFMCEIKMFVLSAILLLLSFSFGYKFIVLSFLYYSILKAFYFNYIAGKQVDYSLKRQLSDYSILFIVAGIAYGACILLPSLNVYMSILFKIAIYCFLSFIQLFLLRKIDLLNI